MSGVGGHPGDVSLLWFYIYKGIYMGRVGVFFRGIRSVSHGIPLLWSCPDRLR